MNQEMINIMTAIYRLELIKELYDQRIIDQENYKDYLVSISGDIISKKEETEVENGGSTN